MKHIALTILTAGAFATLAFDTFGQALAPLFGYAKLASVGLVGATLNTLLGANPAGAAYLLHILTGLIVYAAGCFCRPARPTCGPPIADGVAIWIFALYVMAHLVVGNKPFLGFIGISWVALWGHVIYTLLAAAIIEARGVVFDLPGRPCPSHS